MIDEHDDESLRNEWSVMQLLVLVFPNDQEQLFPPGLFG